MAIYLPNVTDYVPQTEAFTPDYKFLNDVLSVRQDRYDSNYKAMNNMYGQVVHADVSREDSKSTRDQYTEHLIPKLHQIAGLDLSLQENVEAAKGLFAPFYENKNMVRDIVWTKQYKNELSKASQYKNSDKSENRKKYDEDSIKNMQFQMNDFMDADSEGMMSVALPNYVKRYDMMTEGFEALQKLFGDKDQSQVTISDDGFWKITQTNGSVLRAQPTGILDKKGNMTFRDPAGEAIRNMTLSDPRAVEYYRMKGYVAARSFAEENMEQYGSLTAGKNAWASSLLKEYKVEETNKDVELKVVEIELTADVERWNAFVAKHGVIEGSNEHKAMLNSQSELESTKEVIKSRKLRKMDAPSDEYNQVLSMYINSLINSDVNNAANAYAQRGAKTEWDETELQKKDLELRNKRILAKEKYNREKKEEEVDNINAPSRVTQPEDKEGFAVEALTVNNVANLNADNIVKESETLASDKFSIVKAYFNEINKNKEHYNPNEITIDFDKDAISNSATPDNPTIVDEMINAGNTHKWSDLEKAYADGDEYYVSKIDNLYEKAKTQILNYKKNESEHWLGEHVDMIGDVTFAMSDYQSKLNNLNRIIQENHKINTETENYVASYEGNESFKELKEMYGITLFDEDGVKRTQEQFQVYVNEVIEAYSPNIDFSTVTGHLVATNYGDPLNPGRVAPTGVLMPPSSAPKLPKGFKYVETGAPGEHQMKPVFVGINIGKTYEELIESMNVVHNSADATGEDAGLPLYNVMAELYGSDYVGAGNIMTKSFGGAYDPALPNSKNEGAETTDNFLRAMDNLTDGQIIIKSNDNVLDDLEDTNNGKTYVKEMQTRLKLKNPDYTYTINYNEHASGEMAYDNETGESLYSVYTIQATEKTSSKLETSGNVKRILDNNSSNTIKVYVPKGEVYNSHDLSNKRRHHWEVTLQDKGEFTLENPIGGSIKYYKDGEGNVTQVLSYNTYNPDCNCFKFSTRGVQELGKVKDYNQWAKISAWAKNDLNAHSRALSNKQNKRKQESK